MKKLDKARVDSTIESTIPRIRSNSGDNSDTDSELSDDEGSVNGRVEGGGKKMNEKKTKAERNKMRRQNALKQEALKVQAEKRLSQDLHSIKTITKDIAKEEQQRNIASKTKKALLKEKNSQPPGMTYTEAGSVLLTDELSGSLRTLKPELCPIKSHIDTMVVKGDVIRKDARKRKAYERPHGGKQVKWVARYKYT